MANIGGVNRAWERLSRVIEESGMTVHSFALSIGLSRSQTLYQIKHGQIGISKHIAELVCSHYPQFSAMWLQSGEGAMYSEQAAADGHIPLYSCDLMQVVNIDSLTPESYIYLPFLGNADFAITYHGEDMSPAIPSGSVIVLSQTDATSIVYGNEYLIITANLALLRRVRTTESVINFRLEADDPRRFDNIEIRRADISAIYAVKARIILKN